MNILRKYPDFDGYIRIITTIILKTKTGWSKPRVAIIDTGAHTSIFPLTVWKEALIEIIGEYFVSGLIPKEECVLNIKIGWLSAILIDKMDNKSDIIRFRAYLALTDNLPLIIGFKDIMDRCELHLNSKTRSGYIEII